VKIIQNLFEKIWALDNRSNKNCHISLCGSNKAIADDRLIIKGTQAIFFSQCRIPDYIHLVIASDEDKSLDYLLNMRESLACGGLSTDADTPATYTFDELISEGKQAWFTSEEKLMSIEEVISTGHLIEANALLVINC